MACTRVAHLGREHQAESLQLQIQTVFVRASSPQVQSHDMIETSSVMRPSRERKEKVMLFMIERERDRGQTSTLAVFHCGLALNLASRTTHPLRWDQR
jgi:hypothetical protein